MELEYLLAELIGKAKTHDQFTNALRAYEVTAFRLNTDENSRMIGLLSSKQDEITRQEKEHMELAFSIRKLFGIQNHIKPAIRIYEPMESCGVTAENVAKVADTLTSRKVA